MVTVHHLNASRSNRVLWLLEELELPYEIVRYSRQPTLLAPPELRKIHPLGKSPVITDEGRTIAESGAILEYLLERYGNGRLLPAQDDLEGRIRYRYWMHYAEGSLMPLLFLKLVMHRLPQKPTPALIRPLAKAISVGVQGKLVDPQLRQHVAFIDAALAQSHWLAGEGLTAADVQMSYPLEALMSRAGLPPSSAPRVVALLERIHARPAYQRAVSKGGEPMPVI